MILNRSALELITQPSRMAGLWLTILSALFAVGCAEAGSTGLSAINVDHLDRVTAVHQRILVERPDSEQFKIIFGWRAFYNPATPGPQWVYLIETNVWSFRVEDSLTECQQGLLITDRSAASYSIATPDYQFENPQAGGQGHVGLRRTTPSTEGAFGLRNGGIDAIPGLTKIDSWVRASIADEIVDVTIERVGEFSNPQPQYGSRFLPDGTGGFRCAIEVPPGEYMRWRITTRIGAQAYAHEALLPLAYGAYIRPDWLFNLQTEFLSWPGTWRAYYWDIWVQDERQGRVVLRDFVLDYRDNGGNPTPRDGWGIKLGNIDNHPAIEVSSDGVSRYLQPGETIRLDSTPVVIPVLSRTGRIVLILTLLLLAMRKDVRARMRPFIGRGGWGR